MKKEIREQLGQYDPEDIVDFSKEILRAQVKNNPVLESPTVVRDYLIRRVRHHEREVFGVVWLSTRHMVIAVEELFYGTVDGASVYCREVVKAGLARNAAACLFYHNHPSGSTEPSAADKRITERLKQSLGLVDIRVLDHLIVANDEAVSFAERGLM